MTTTLSVEQADGDITIALPAKLLMDTLREFSEQPLTFDINTENLAVVFRTETGHYNFIGQNGTEYPQAPELSADANKLAIDVSVLSTGINKT